MRSSVRSFLPDLVVSPASRESEELACKFEAYRKNLKFTLNPTKRRLLRLLVCYSAGDEISTDFPPCRSNLLSSERRLMLEKEVQGDFPFLLLLPLLLLLFLLPFLLLLRPRSPHPPSPLVSPTSYPYSPGRRGRRRARINRRLHSQWWDPLEDPTEAEDLFDDLSEYEQHLFFLSWRVVDRVDFEWG